MIFPRVQRLSSAYPVGFNRGMIESPLSYLLVLVAVLKPTAAGAMALPSSSYCVYLISISTKLRVMSSLGRLVDWSAAAKV